MRDRGLSVETLFQDLLAPTARRLGELWARTSEKSARDTFFYYTGSKPSAVRYKNCKLYFQMAGACASCGLAGVETYKWPLVDNIKRDPFEGAVGDELKTLLGQGGALAGPVTAYLYDWNIIPLGQILWLKELESSVRIRRCRIRRPTIWIRSSSRSKSSGRPVTAVIKVRRN